MHSQSILSYILLAFTFHTTILSAPLPAPTPIAGSEVTARDAADILKTVAGGLSAIGLAIPAGVLTTVAAGLGGGKAAKPAAAGAKAAGAAPGKKATAASSGAGAKVAKGAKTG